MLRVMNSFFLASLVPLTAGHGHISNIVINGVSYEGWDINVFPYESDPPTVIAWGTPNTSNGFITPDATNAKGHAPVAAGDKINLQWTTWPDTHHGPVITYLANCGDSCETVDKTTLEFFKISEVGLVDETDVPGTWGDDQLIANNNSWLVEIPPTLKPGYYVLRNEIIALHGAEALDGAQNYPQCINLQVTGSGTAEPSGVLGTDLYSSTDAGIYVNIYSSLSTYEIPGPTLFSGAVSVTQSSSSITASGTPVSGYVGTTTQTTASGATSNTSTAVSTSNISVATSSTTLQTTTAPATTTTAISSGSTQSVYGQCGGTGWTGATACNTQATCTSLNSYYYQCVPTAN